MRCKEWEGTVCVHTRVCTCMCAHVHARVRAGCTATPAACPLRSREPEAGQWVPLAPEVCAQANGGAAWECVVTPT